MNVYVNDLMLSCVRACVCFVCMDLFVCVFDILVVRVFAGLLACLFCVCVCLNALKLV